MQRVHGSVLSWGLGRNQDYGFLRPDHNGADVFCFQKSLSPNLHSLNRGERVTFIETATPRGLAASDVQLEVPEIPATRQNEGPVDRTEKRNMR